MESDILAAGLVQMSSSGRTSESAILILESNGHGSTPLLDFNVG